MWRDRTKYTPIHQNLFYYFILLFHNLLPGFPSARIPRAPPPVPTSGCLYVELDILSGLQTEPLQHSDNTTTGNCIYTQHQM